MNVDVTAFERALAEVENLNLITPTERSEVRSTLDDGFPFAGALGFADSVHAHIKVADVDTLPHAEFAALGYRPENPEPGYLKYATDAGVNFIFSSIPIAQDDGIPGAVALAKPFMDHVGIDMRDEADATRQAFDGLVARIAELGWRRVTQEGPVHCCHTQVKSKHWAYPPECWRGWRRPIEFAFGTLVVFDKIMGCDLRPIDPGHPLASAGAPACCGAPASDNDAETLAARH
jgi:hypothetical protein